MKPHICHILSLFIGLLALTSCQTVRTVETRATYWTIPPGDEAVLGKEFAEQIEEEVDIVHDPMIQAWINKMGQSLLRHSPPIALDFTFQVTTSDQVNAFAIPGGYCYINTGLILLADNEAQVAAVVGHEINHVTVRHGIRSLQRAVGIQLIGQAVAGDGTTAAAVQAISNAGGVLAMRGFGREDEREADRLGVEAMYRAGYDPREAAGFFEKLQAAEQAAGRSDSFLGRIMATHPTTTERIQNIRAQVQQYDLSRPMIVDTPEFPTIQQRLRQLTGAGQKKD